MNDQIDRAVKAAAEAEGEVVSPATMLRITVTLSSTQRLFGIEIPSDMTESELIEASAWMLSTLANHLASERAKTSRLFVPFGPVPPIGR